MKPKILFIAIDILMTIFLAVFMIAAVGTALKKEPFILTAVRSNSMYPIFKRGDMLFIKAAGNGDFKTGDIAVFKAQEGELSSKGWIVHRVIGGNKDEGYLTKGDANDETDQASGDSLIKPEWITGRVLSIGTGVIKIPLLGYLSLWMEDFQKNPYFIPLVTILLAITIGMAELAGGKKKKRKATGLEMPMIYFFSGLTLSIMLGASMVAYSQHVTLSYEVSKDEQGAMMGSAVGVLKIGESVEKPLSDLENKGFFPVTAIITSNDEQIRFNYDKITLTPQSHVQIKMNVTGEREGSYNSVIHVGLFYPFLPKNLLYIISSVNYWLAVIVLSIIPGLPIMLFSIFDRKLRREISKSFRHRLNQIKAII